LKSGKDTQGVEAGGEACEVDSVADGNARQDPVSRRELGLVSINVDDNQACWAAGDSNAEPGIVPPPPLDVFLVQGGGVEAVTPTARTQAGAVSRSVGTVAALYAVRGWCLAARGEWVHGPAPAGTPLCYGKGRSDRRLRGIGFR
jgi:hypothetical protein